MSAADALPVPSRAASSLSGVRVFRPAVERDGPEQVHRVEVVGVVRIAGESLAACRDLDDPPWHYEVLSPLPLVIGVTGSVRYQGLLSLLLPRWILVDPFWPKPEPEPTKKPADSGPESAGDPKCGETNALIELEFDRAR